MSRLQLSTSQWTQILQFLRGRTDLYVGREEECRRFIEAVLWVDRSGAQWRLLPAEYGNWNSVYKRFARWADRGIWELMHQHFADDPDMEYLICPHLVTVKCQQSLVISRSTSTGWPSYPCSTIRKTYGDRRTSAWCMTTPKSLGGPGLTNLSKS